MQTILSPNRSTGRVRPIRAVVVHTMESPEAASTAENVAAYFARSATRASAHVCADADSLVRCVPDTDTAWAAPGLNADGLQLELAGRAAQGPDGWADAYSVAELELAAQQVAQWCTEHSIPVRRLSVAQVADGTSRGICGHIDVTRAFRKSTHTDPGADFPWDAFLARVAALVAGAPAAAAPAPTLAAPSGLTVDGSFGPATTAALQRTLGVPADGSFGPITRRALQARLGVAQDGSVGPITVRALQRALTARGAALAVDGSWGPATTSALQRALNAGQLW